MTKARRQSVSSSSSSSSDDEHHHGNKQDKKNKKHGEKHTATAPGYPPPFTGPPTAFQQPFMSGPPFPNFPSPPGPPPSYSGPPHSFPSPHGMSEHDRGVPQFPAFPGGDHPPFSPASPQSRPQPPPSGYRVPLTALQSFPAGYETGQPVSYDLDGRSPLFMGSALLESSVHPCKIAPALQPVVRVPYGGTEYEHNGRYDLLPFDANTMEWVPADSGRLPHGKRPVEGGYEDHGAKLYHALAVVNGVKVPGKVGEHLGGAHVPFGGGEHTIREYEILCWKY